MKRCQLLKPGLVEYGKAWGLQKEIFHARTQQEIIDTLLILQHPPTYTFGRRSLVGQSILSFEKEHENFPPLQGEGGYGLFSGENADIFHVDRGGGATYHGPGQLVGYPIIELKSYTTDFHTYLRMLEDVMIRALADFNIQSQRLNGYTGVWVNGEKIGSIGVRIIRGFTMHGFSLNVNNDLAPFDKIIPCNINGVKMTSMSKLKGTTLNIKEVEESLISKFASVFNVLIQ